MNKINFKLEKNNEIIINEKNINCIILNNKTSFIIDSIKYLYDNNMVDEIELIDIDHDAGIYASDGGDYIKLLDWLEETGRNYPIRIHSQNSVGVQNMRAIIQKNGWREIK